MVQHVVQYCYVHKAIQDYAETNGIEIHISNDIYEEVYYDQDADGNDDRVEVIYAEVDPEVSEYETDEDEPDNGVFKLVAGIRRSNPGISYKEALELALNEHVGESPYAPVHALPSKLPVTH